MDPKILMQINEIYRNEVYSEETLSEAKEDESLTTLQKIRKRNKRDSESLVSRPGGQTDERRSYHKAGRGEKKEKGAKSAFGTMRHVGGPYNEELDLYDIVSEYLVSEGFCDSYEDADVIMANMSEEWRESILESAKDQSDKQIERGVKTTYKAGNVLDNRHQGRSRGLNKIDPRERDSKVERMRARLDSRRDDLFKERNKREDEKMEKIRKLLGL
jgi:hypothetical protein